VPRDFLITLYYEGVSVFLSLLIGMQVASFLRMWKEAAVAHFDLFSRYSQGGGGGEESQSVSQARVGPGTSRISSRNVTDWATETRQRREKYSPHVIAG
jgi:hypothetical protein